MKGIHLALFWCCRGWIAGVCLLAAAGVCFGASEAPDPGGLTLVSITVKPHTVSIVVGATQQFTAIGTFSNGRKRDITQRVQWVSLATNVATITPAGLATGVAAGQSKITATLQTIHGSSILRVMPVLVSITVTPADTSIVVGTSQQFTATGNYSDGSSQDLTSSSAWNSSATDIVSISGTGLASALPGGVPPGGPPAQVEITATYDAVNGSTSLTVTNNLTSITLNPSTVALAIDAQQAFTASGIYQDASTHDITALATWSSSDTSVLTVALICSVELATGVAAGPVTITATQNGISSTATGMVTTPPPSPGIDASFFGMTIGDTAQYPPTDTVPIGAIGHPTLLAWYTIEPDKGVFDFSAYDKFADWASQNNVPLMVTFGWTPWWAVQDPKSCIKDLDYKVCTGNPAQMSDWTDFIQTVIDHYDGGEHPSIRYYELWDEANDDAFWSGGQVWLSNMAKAAYSIIHQNPNSLLLTPSTTNAFANARDWMRSYLTTQCGFLYADGGTFHGYLAANGESPYPFPEDDSPSGYGDIAKRTQVFRTLFDLNGLGGKPMFDTEGSWGQANITDPDLQVAWLARWYLIQAGVKADNGTSAVQAAYWFAWGYSNPLKPEDQQWGLISDADGNTPTDAGIAYGQVYNWLVGATISTCTSSTNLWTCPLVRSGNYEGLAVWYYSAKEDGTTSYTPGPQFQQYRDLGGTVTLLNGSDPITIGPKPILLESGPPPRN